MKPGYVQLAYGQRQGLETPAQLDLPASGDVTVNMALPRSGVITVRLTNRSGEPVVGFMATALARRFNDGRATLTNAGATPFSVTDDRGEVRLFGLAPGDYYVSARPGPVTPLDRPRTVAETFYPGTPVLEHAAKVSVAAGSEVSVTFVVEEARLARIAGAVFDSSGAPVTDGRLTLRLDQSSGHQSRMVDRMPDGTFVAAALAPGEYLLQVQTGDRPGGVEYASARVRIDGTDLDGLTLGTRAGARIRGRIAFDDPSGPPPPRSLHMRVVATAVNEPPLSLGRAVIRDDWSFEIIDVMTRGVLRFEGDEAGWWIKSLRIDGREVGDLPIDFGARAAFDNVDVLLSRKTAQIAGTAVGFRAGDAPRFVVVVFPADPNLWTGSSRRIAVGRLDQTGRFAIANLPPGDYQVIAVEQLQRGAERDPEMLRRLAPLAPRVQLREGEVTSLVVQIEN